MGGMGGGWPTLRGFRRVGPFDPFSTERSTRIRSSVNLQLTIPSRGLTRPGVGKASPIGGAAKRAGE